MLSLTANIDVRTFKKGDNVTLQFNSGLCVMVGDNGSGKSTITNTIRGYFINQEKAVGVGDSLNNTDIKHLSKAFNIQTDYDYCCCVDFYLDNPLASNNSYDAVEFLMNGGYAVQHKSHGECQAYMLSRLLKQLDGYRKSHPTNKILLILDEPENGLSIPKQYKLVDIVIPGLIRKYKLDLLVMTHNPILVSSVSDVFDVGSKKYVSVKEYLPKR